MGRWETTSELAAGVTAAAIWDRAYADPKAWPRWNAEILIEPAAAGALPGAQRAVVELAT